MSATSSKFLHKVLTKTVGILLTLLVSPIFSDNTDFSDPRSAAANTLVDISVSGKTIKEDVYNGQGTGFAVTNDLVVTAKHITREDSFFFQTIDGINSPDRKVEASWHREFTGYGGKAGPIYTKAVRLDPIADIALVHYPDGKFKSYPINTCPPKFDDKLLILRWDPSEKTKLEPEFLEVKARRWAASSQGIYIRLVAHRDIEYTNSGSPIFNENGQVVGLLSLKDRDHPKIGYMTPMVDAITLLTPFVYLTPCALSSLTDELTWITNDKSIKLGIREGEGFCFITKVQGIFNNTQDEVRIEVHDDEFVLGGNNGGGGQHQGSARCVRF